MANYLIKTVGGLGFLAVLAYLLGNLTPYAEMKNIFAYTLATVTRITITLIISVLWGVSFGILAATNKKASLIITPIIDLLQSVPILGYFPLVIGFLFRLGPLGIELSVVILLFTSMAWAIFFGVIGAIKTIPNSVADAAKSYGLTGWKYVRHIILPAINPAVIAGANLAWSDGWFFMIAAEYIQYKEEIVVPPSGGLGVLLAKAAYFYQDMRLATYLLIFITALVIIINSLTWHRLMEEAGTRHHRANIQLSGVGQLGFNKIRQISQFKIHTPKAFAYVSQRIVRNINIISLASTVVFIVLAIVFALGHPNYLPNLSMIIDGFNSPPSEEVAVLPQLILLTFGRLTFAYIVSLIIAIGLGVAAAENKTAALIIYPLYDIGQGVPILALFPVIYLGFGNLLGSQRLALELTCIVMLILDMIWYMFINITSAVKNIPAEIKEVGQLFGFKGIHRITHLIIPSILPSIVTGSILSWGTGWNTIIFSEYLQSNQPGVPDVWIPGIGSFLDKAGYVYGNTVILVFILVIIAVIVLSMEALIWRRLLKRFEKIGVDY